MPTSKSSGGGSKRGFASMDGDKQREIASKGGKAAHEKGTAHEFDSAEAREAGRKGGEASHAGKSRSGSHASSSGRGGSSTHHARLAATVKK
ncbi:MAG: KGG domain-containing protein [Nitrosospira sp.]